ncbi:membrane lipoprotein lipid attachment site-containing protein [Brevibacillus daliensis]|uniref:membrane lipoprotein lipid attachment site-containing protein n=1 Tax=Brevibacillus daliensis TaxID=2892995 RepID=UPI001E2B288E|nr:membrane lipoprotein lipid attachment site-containing protein [Brevibacillus daliensis]
MKKIFLLLVLVGIVSGCAVSAQGEIHQRETTSEEEQANKSNVEKLIVQRGHDIFAFTKPSQNMGILVNAIDLFRLTYRKSDENIVVKNERELEFLQESQEEGTSQNDYTYIRIIQTPYIPEVGENAFPRKDIVLYIDRQYPNDVFVGVQNPIKLDEWEVYKVKDYSNWLKKDIDLYISLYKGL